MRCSLGCCLQVRREMGLESRFPTSCVVSGGGNSRRALCQAERSSQTGPSGTGRKSVPGGLRENFLFSKLPEDPVCDEHSAALTAVVPRALSPVVYQRRKTRPASVPTIALANIPSAYHVPTNALVTSGQCSPYAVAASPPDNMPAANPATAGRVGANRRNAININASVGSDNSAIQSEHTRHV